jgi:hypothetical protein
VPFFLSAPPTAIAQNAKLTQNESGVKPPHSKTIHAERLPSRPSPTTMLEMRVPQRRK